MAYLAGAFVNIVNDSIRPMIDLSLKWMEADNANWYSYDRGAAFDVYKGTFDARGTRAAMDYLAATLNDYKEEITVGFTGEPVFGPEVTVTLATVIGWPKLVRQSLNYWSLDGIKLAAVDPISSGHPNINLLKLAKNSYESDHEYAIIKNRMINGSWAYADRSGGGQTFTGLFRNTNTEYAAIRRAIINSRGGTIAFPDIQGITYPFGPNGLSDGGNCKIKALKNERRVSLGWEFELEIVREFDTV